MLIDYNFRIIIHPEDFRFIMHVPGDCACLGGFSSANEGIKLVPHNIDNLRQQFLHLYGIAVLWKIAWDAGVADVE